MVEGIQFCGNSILQLPSLIYKSCENYISFSFFARSSYLKYVDR